MGVGREEAAKQGGQAHRGLRVEEAADRGAAPAGRTTRPSRRTLRWWEMVGWATSRFHDVGYEALVANPSARWSGGMAGWAWRCRPRGQRMIRWIGRHHHRGRGRPHRYSLADFGLEPAVVDRRFARSREWVSAVTLS